MAEIAQIVDGFLRDLSNSILPLVVFVTGVLVAIIIGRLSRRLFIAAEVPEGVEGTRFERTVNRLGTSTIGLLSGLITLFLIALAVGLTLSIGGVLDTRYYLELLRGYLLQVFVAALVVIIGLIVGDKAEVEIKQSLQDVKLTEVSLLPSAVKYSILFVASLIALAQLRIETGALLVVLGGYLLGIIVLGGLAFKDLLAAGAAGVFLIFSEPYSIGDTVNIDDHRGIVQEVGLFATHIESDEEEFILPNHLVLRSGIVRIRS
ncbi:mechanosensitive ion channel domain-containing protein [Halocatena salina]|uniref:Mechanosensitive ion channel n=1 Tax=Halocatena salina TaxID=2934340 RepID=A0A8U0A010_9EURY|nr:mechanosensitive ion channel domain-containing protein [Halocatena salina]UPM42156.1 mechanosensitive ion channel [Halocatena salina]